MKNIWILTEEMPKSNVIEVILGRIASDCKLPISADKLRILPIMENDRFVFKYKIENITCGSIDSVFIKMVSGSSSFVDFLIFIQESEPDQNSVPLYAIEETKTDDSESRNTGVYQRCSKFVYVDFYYPDIKKIMLYNLLVPQKEKPTQTNIFGMRMLKTIGVEVLGKICSEEVLTPFSNLNELIEFKNSMRMPPAGNTPIKISASPNSIKVSGRLFKSGGLSHDPNIGALSIIAACIRKWEKEKDIIITFHGLKQKHVGKNNKFIQIANKINIKLDGLKIPATTDHESYWHYELSQEKVATIFMHIALLAYTDSEIIYANHGGAERSYFVHRTQELLAIPKYQQGKKKFYKAGNKKMIIFLPDMIVYDKKRNEVVDVEGKKFTTRKAGISELKNFSYIDNKIIRPSYDPDSIARTVVVFGGKEKSVLEKQISFVLNEYGELLLGKEAPECFKEVVKKLLGR
ncbi:MAG: hypothetical protein WC536_05125 [Patescibacteria group bacterium]